MRPNTRRSTDHTTKAIEELPVTGSWITEPMTEVPLGEPPLAARTVASLVVVESPEPIDVEVDRSVVDVLPPTVVLVVDDVVVDDVVVDDVVVVATGVAVHVMPAGWSAALVTTVIRAFQNLSSCVADAVPFVQAIPRLYSPEGTSPGANSSRLMAGTFTTGPGPPTVVAFAVWAFT